MPGNLPGKGIETMALAKHEIFLQLDLRLGARLYESL
jgi:hypothetical protein